MKLFIGNLPYDVTATDLVQLFSGFGEIVNSNLVVDQFSGRPKGFAFVEMSSRSEGHKAMESLNGSEFKHRRLVCNEAKPLKKKGKRSR